jgi:aminotransferase EvaB
MDKILEIAKLYNLGVIEDCSQAHGATYKNKKAGSMGDIGIFSFYPTKILGAYGDGGMAITNNEEYANRLKRLRFYGMENAYSAIEHGFNSRLDEVHAKILNLKLKSLDQYLLKRRAIAKAYDSALKNSTFELPYTHKDNEHAYYLYVIKSSKRELILKKLEQKNIKLSISYPYPIHLMSAYTYLGYKPGDLPITEGLASKIFSLPMYPSLKEKDQSRVIESLIALSN